MPRPPLIWLSLLLLQLQLLQPAAAAGGAAAPAAASCPADLPAGCACKESSARLSISCVSVPLASVLPSLAGRAVDSLRLVNCSVTALEPRQLNLKGLRTLELAHCGIAAVDPEALVSLSASLEELLLPDNRLTAIPLGLRPLFALTKLNLNRNLISDLPPGALSFAPRLSQLRLEENRICSLGLNSLNETKSTLALLDLSGNCLSSLSTAGFLRSAPALAFLDLSGNKLIELSPLSLLSLPSLVELRLSDNLLARLAPLCISATPELRYLYLQNNLLDSLTTLPALAKLDILDARANRLTTIPLLAESPSLRQLRLDSNRISAIESRALAANGKLQLLSLQDNLLSSLSPASFDGLQQLAVLLLANNRLEKLEAAPLSPLRSLAQLNLRNNSISVIAESALAPLKQLNSFDVAGNALTSIDKGLFEPLPKLFWVDLSGNKLATLEKGTFAKRISNLLLEGNPIVCDEALDWFVQWLVVNRVRTFLPNQPDVVCAAPPAYEGVKLKELMIKKANETMKVMGLQPEKPKAGQALVNNLLPGMSIMNSLVPAGQQAAQAAAGLGQIPGLGSLLNGIPSLRNLALAPAGGAAAGAGALPAPGAVRSMNSAVEQFAAPLVRFATGGQPQAADFDQLMQAIPRMIEAAPGGAAAAIDVSKLQPSMIAHVLRGGQIPGIPKDTMDRLIAGHMQKMAELASAVARGEHPADLEKYLPPLSSLPPDLIMNVMNGASLPALAAEQMEPIKQYYMNTLPLAPGTPGAPSNAAGAAPAPAIGGGAALPAFELTPQSLDMLRLLPAGYDLTKIPMQIMTAISRGEVPDLKLLPAELQEHLKSNTDKMLAMFQGSDAAPKKDMREVLAKLPSWERPVETATYSPYDMNAKKPEPTAEELSRARTYRLMTAGVIGLLALVSVIAVVSMCIAQHRKLAYGSLESTSSRGGASTTERMRGFSTPTMLSSVRDSTHISQQPGVVHRRSPPQIM